MITIKKSALTFLVMILVAGETMAGEEAEYSVVLEDDKFELRQYEPHIVAETLVDGDFEDAGSSAFKALFGYISGDNKSQQDISMTAPVSQKVASEKIAMTSPVGQQKTANKWAVSFMM
ncbi:MAG: heme-binding protein, partial [Psychromonas sp.]